MQRFNCSREESGNEPMLCLSSEVHMEKDQEGCGAGNRDGK